MIINTDNAPTSQYPYPLGINLYLEGF